MKQEIIQAEILGFCSGVKRAMETALKLREDFPQRKIFTFDQLIHNNEAVKFLESKKIYALEKQTALTLNKNFSDAIIIVCAHGIEVEAKMKLEKNFKTVIDATCPHVLQSQKKAFTAAKENCNVILVGEKKHQEVLSIKSYVDLAEKKKCIIIANLAEAKKLALKLTSADLPICLIAQTTLKQTEYNEIAKVFSQKVSAISDNKCEQNFNVLKTICPATQKRQDALIKLAHICDAVLIVGGKNSTNTNRLFITAKKIQPNSFLVENADELPPEVFSAKKLGIAAGASTPDFVLESIKQKLGS
ncbi:MAG: 4-hydroxy-3-methylbut-2-enyl diphosphate reductase [Treponemataceae bacterium]